MTTRETIYNALFTTVSAALPNFKTKSRFLLDFSEVAPEQQPALFQMEVSESYAEKKGFPLRATLLVDLYLYVSRATKPGDIPSTVINNALDAIESALAPAVCEDTQTLGGVVSHAWMENATIFEPLTGDQSVVVVRVNLMRP